MRSVVSGVEFLSAQRGSMTVELGKQLTYYKIFVLGKVEGGYKQFELPATEDGFNASQKISERQMVDVTIELMAAKGKFKCVQIVPAAKK